ncbi:MAG: hypothetical protein ABSH33_22825 [Steroidobacteraceae bacterium]|jgi:NADPH:quinone reductase-like Zn-dependent oxidoreductase
MQIRQTGVLYSKQDFVAEVSRISGGEKLPVVFDFVGKDAFQRSLDCLRRRKALEARATSGSTMLTI